MFFGLAPSWEILSTSAVWRKNSTIENQFVIDCKNFHWISQKTKNAKKKKLFFFSNTVLNFIEPSLIKQ